MSLTKKLKYYDEFQDWYKQILIDFEYNYKEDLKARNILNKILLEKVSKENIEDILKNIKDRFQIKKDILVYACGPSLEENVNSFLKNNGREIFNSFFNIAADGASVLLRKKDIRVDALFTDLDGVSKKEFKDATLKVVHAHGDNIEKVKHFEKLIKNEPNVIGTTQTNPQDTLLLNPGGFTDGDRIFFFIKELLNQKNRLFLIGMDFGDVVGKYSKKRLRKIRKAKPVKIKKLKYAFKFLKWINEDLLNQNILIYFINPFNRFNEFNNISIEEFLQKIK
jgi:hypothetical protein